MIADLLIAVALALAIVVATVWPELVERPAAPVPVPAVGSAAPVENGVRA